MVDDLHNGLVGLDVSLDHLGAAGPGDALGARSLVAVVHAKSSLGGFVDGDIGVLQICAPALDLCQTLLGEQIVRNDVVVENGGQQSLVLEDGGDSGVEARNKRIKRRVGGGEDGALEVGVVQHALEASSIDGRDQVRQTSALGCLIDGTGLGTD